MVGHMPNYRLLRFTQSVRPYLNGGSGHLRLTSSLGETRENISSFTFPFCGLPGHSSSDALQSPESEACIEYGQEPPCNAVLRTVRSRMTHEGLQTSDVVDFWAG
jgi:hypothetical protein